LPLPPLESSTQWAIYGRVYDLITLRPVAEVQLNFQANAGGGAGYAQTDEYGRFAAVLGRLPEGSYEIHASRPDYASSVLYEPDIPYSKLSLEARREMAQTALEGDIPLPPLTDVTGDDSMRRDLFLVPRR
jgi:hypothetical protein